MRIWNALLSPSPIFKLRLPPGWMAHDFRLMLQSFHRFGMIPGKDSRTTFEALIGHLLRSYRAFAEEAAANW